MRLAGLSSQSPQGGCFAIDETQTSTAGVIARVDDLASWVNSAMGAGRITDYNGDGVEDIAIGDPAATVGTDTSAGVVRVSYGGGKGTAEINQDLDWVPGGAEQSDWFGEQLATVDYNEDGYTDLVVGTPNETLGTATDAGMVDVIFGAGPGRSGHRLGEERPLRAGRRHRRAEGLHPRDRGPLGARRRRRHHARR